MAIQGRKLRKQWGDQIFDAERSYKKLTLFPFSIKARSQTATSPANLLNSRTCVSSSDDHLLTISSIVLPFSIEGGCTETLTAVEPPIVDKAERGFAEKWYNIRTLIEIHAKNGTNLVHPFYPLPLMSRVDQAPSLGYPSSLSLLVHRTTQTTCSLIIL